MHLRSPTFRCTPLVLALGLALSSGAWAGTTVVAVSGAPAPGTEFGVTFASLGSVRLNAAGQVAYGGSLAGAKVDASNRSGLWRDGTLVARTGVVAPGAGGKAVLSSFSLMRLNAAGQVAYIGGLSGADVTAANGQGLWRDDTLVTRLGDLVPSAGSNVTLASFSSSISGMQLNAQGQVAYIGALLNTATGVKSGAILRNTTVVARVGNAATGTGSGVTFAGFFSPLKFNDAGQVAYQATLTGTGVDTTNDMGLWRDGVLVARKGQAAPGAGSGVTLGSFAFESDDGSLQLNAAGQVAYLTLLVGTSVTASNNFALWRNNTLVARTGQAAPGVGGGAVFSNFSRSLRLNEAGSVAYAATLTGEGVSAQNNFGIWRDDTRIVRTGDALTGGTGSERFSSVGLVGVNLGGQVAFQGGVTSDSQPTALSGVFLGDGVEVVQVARVGDQLAGSSIVNVQGGDVLTPGSSFNDKAQLAYTATLADGRSGIFLFTPALRWRSTTGGSWADAANWTLSLNPADVHDVTLDPSNSLTITGPSNTVAVKSLRIGTGAGIATLAMAGGRIDAQSVQVGPQGVLSGTGSFGSLVSNQGVLRAERLQILGGLDNAGTVRGATGLGSRLETNLNNTSGGRVRVDSGETLQLFGTAHQNAGVVEVNGGRLETSGGFTNAKAGTVDLKNATVLADGSWRNEKGARLLLNEARLTTTAGFNNAGQVQVTSGSSEVFGSVVNEAGGQIILSGQGTTTFYDSFDAQKSSELRVSSGATAVFFGAVQQRSGAVFSGSGLKYYEGGFSVGNSPGAASDGGDVTFGLGNTYLAELGGTVAGTGFDHYSVAGTLTLNGGLVLTSWDGFTGQAGQSFDLFDWGQLQGQFASVDSSGLLLAEGTRLDLSRLYVDGTVSVTAVPEPATWALWFSGLVALGVKARRGRRVGAGV